MNLMRAWECDGQFSLLSVKKEYCTPDFSNAYFRKYVSSVCVCVCACVSYLKILTSASTSGERWSGACVGTRSKKEYLEPQRLFGVRKMKRSRFLFF